MHSMVEAITPSRMGSGFRWMLASSWLTNLGDGIALAAGPLLIASQTRNPSIIASAVLLQRLPWLIFGLYSGWIADRTDRRQMIVLANSGRAIVLALLSLMIATDNINVAVVLGALFVLGIAETFADTAANTLLPMLVRKADLGIGNARLSFGRRALNELVGPPLGAAIFALGHSAPFVTEAALVALGVITISQIAASPPAEVAADKGIRKDILAGVKWLWGNAPIRTLTITILLFNLTFGAMWPMLVLYAIEVLETGEVGFGLLLSASAVGGLVGAASYGFLEKHVSLATLMRFGLGIETLVHLGLVLSRSVVVSMAILAVFGAQAMVWGTTSAAIRQRAVPENFQGRVGSVYLVGVFGGLVGGGALGAIISGIWGVLAPFWFAFVGSAVFLALTWKELGNVAHADSLIQEETSNQV